MNSLASRVSSRWNEGVTRARALGLVVVAVAVLAVAASAGTTRDAVAAGGHEACKVDVGNHDDTDVAFVTLDRINGVVYGGLNGDQIINALADVIMKQYGKQVPKDIVGKYRKGDIRHCYADTQLANELLGFRAEIPFEAGMQELLAWLEGQEAADSVDAAREALVARGLAR